MAGEPFVMINFKVTPEEQKLIEKHAKDDDMSVSDYVRSCVYIDMIQHGDFQALRLLGKRAWTKVAPRMKRLGWARIDEIKQGK